VEKVEYPVKDNSGKEVGKASLAAQVFAVEPNKNLIHETVRWQRAKKRAGTHATILRGEMIGGGKKPFKQKGTGRARAGSIISPLWVGGAVVFGPQPRDYEFRLSKRSKKTALISTLSMKVADSSLIILENFSSVDGKTKSFVELISSLGIEGKKVLLVIADGDVKATETKLWKAARNVDRVKPVSVQGVNVYDLLNSDIVLTCKNCIGALESRLNTEQE
jgi:large subunit ribosomal protein L4